MVVKKWKVVQYHYTKQYRMIPWYMTESLENNRNLENCAKATLKAG